MREAPREESAPLRRLRGPSQALDPGLLPIHPANRGCAEQDQTHGNKKKSDSGVALYCAPRNKDEAHRYVREHDRR